MLNLERLRVLRAIAATGSVRGAAATLHVTTSAVSQQMARLEREIGQPLVERNGRGIRLTDAALLLSEHAGALLAQAEAVETDLARHRGAVVGELRLAAFATAARGLLPTALAALHDRYPALRTRTAEQEPDVALPAVASGDLDLAIAQDWPESPLTLPAGSARTGLLDDVFDVALPAGHRLADRPTLDLVELAADDWVGWSAGQLCHDWLRRTVPDARVPHTASEHATQLALVAAGLGVALLPRLGRDPVPDGVRFAAVRPAPVRRVFAVWRSAAARQPAIRAALAALRDAGRR
ncbi:LysR family transcriptional regulator [Actinocatenispora thailandica]|uniref:LysR family transcriptional regulator n=1 Tax=Actinocatenispora thailandica TaxID=227318 RepID=A0A7R7HWS9_9ACTN|nr:LysR family transcriptional regulator [Actinocatenispora thailandica]BCJ34309.1 LysR family transcriptional regulator [Actinocatenispora thailandica]